jgi:hypothetical protein
MEVCIALPTTDDFLNALFQKKREITPYIVAAGAPGLQIQVAEINSIIFQKGGEKNG